jgi:hypothetical protein
MSSWNNMIILVFKSEISHLFSTDSSKSLLNCCVKCFDSCQQSLSTHLNRKSNFRRFRPLSAWKLRNKVNLVSRKLVKTIIVEFEARNEVGIQTPVLTGIWQMTCWTKRGLVKTEPIWNGHNPKRTHFRNGSNWNGANPKWTHKNI